MIHKIVSETFTGNGTNYIGTKIRGKILAVKVVADNSVTDNFDITLTGETTAIPILVDATVTKNTTTWWHVRQLTANGADGGSATDAWSKIPIVGERIKCVTANAGTTGEITVSVICEMDN